jgi:hypothetical protein
MWLLFLLLVLNSKIGISQQPVSIHKVGYSVEKQADEQTRWMSKELDMNSTVAKEVYQINMKYLLLSDSLRMTTKETLNKKSLHLEITQKKNIELQMVLTSGQYSKYQSILANAKKYSR